jgi:MarR family transcriptional regulator, transcriptional regulator for hemolysin
MDSLPFAGFSLSEAGQLYTRRFEERSRDLALDFAHSRALLVLAENEGVTQQRLSELTATGAAWLVHILDRLEVLGLAERRPHLADRRARSLAITEKAREVLPLLRNIIGESLREALTGLSTKETAILTKALHRVIVNLSALDRPTSVPHPRLRDVGGMR